MQAIERINNLINSLPKRDIPIGFAYLDCRDFDSLQELIDSAIIRTKKNIHSDNPKEEYINVDLDNLNELKAEVDTYSVQLNGFYNDINDMDNYSYEEEFY